MALPHTILHLRSETKPLEHRSCLSPSVTKSLIDAGYEVHVERSSTNPDNVRIFRDDEFETVGAKLVPEGSWTSAPLDHIIIGLKELPEEDAPLSHTMIHFAHCYKGQAGWEKVLSRFARGSGLLYDLEFLQDESGRRVSAFGYHAGFAGAALAIKAWRWQLEHPKEEPMPGAKHFTNGKGYYDNEAELIDQVKEDVLAGEKIAGRKPTAMVMGALGRCGRGACDLFKKAGVPENTIVRWDLDETKDRPGPYSEIVASDLFVNSIYLTEKIPPFVDVKTIDDPNRKLSVICDVSCDPNSENNPLPIYSVYTSFDRPTTFVEAKVQGPPLSVISIDHLPSLLPREASEAFSGGLLPSLLQLKDRKTAPVWRNAEKLYSTKIETLPEGMR